MTYVGSRPANKPVNQTDIEDDAISLAKLAGGTDGNIISYDASGNPVAIATGNDGQVLTSTGAGSPPAFEAVSGTTINNNADNKVITGSGTANTLEGEANLTYTGSVLKVNTTDSAAHGNADDLIVGSSSGNHGITIYSQNNSTGNIHFSDGTSGADQYQGQINYDHAGSNLQFHTVGAEAMRIDSSKNVGIGETAPLGKLHVKTGDSGQGTAIDHGDELVVESSDHGGINILTPYDKTGTLAFGDGSDSDIGYISYNHTNNMMTLSVNADGGTLKMSSDGNLQHGTSTNSGRVSHVSSGNEKIGFFNALNSGSYSQSVAYFHCARNTQNGSYLILEGSHGGGSCFFVADSGNVTNANNSYGQSSDERIKKDIIDANSQWDDIKAVKVKNFKYKSNDSITQLGVVAQDLETSGMNGLIHDSLPTVQDIEADSTFGTLYTEQDKIDENIPEDKKIGDVKEVKEKVKAVKYSVLYMKAIKALQEAQTRIETLETKVTALENA